MLRIPDRPLPPEADQQLRAYQAEVDAPPTYTEQVAEAKRLFSTRNRKDNPTFKVIRETLSAMCSGARRCMYCEDSVADEVEHFKPKDFYPELVFAWPNYLYACGPCNSGKTNKFSVISATTGRIVHLSRPRGAEVAPPEPGDAVLLDLRQENPLDYLQLDLKDTFYFEPSDPNETSLRSQRARWVIDILNLNGRDYLPRARADAYGAYCDRLDLYIRRRDGGATAESLGLLKRSVLRMGHPTVWAEMKRQYLEVPELAALFNQAPEAFEW